MILFNELDTWPDKCICIRWRMLVDCKENQSNKQVDPHINKNIELKVKLKEKQIQVRIQDSEKVVVIIYLDGFKTNRQ